MSDSNSQKVIINVAWPYANGDLHLGHIAGNFLPATISNDFHRLKGNDVVMVSGSDMHGTPIAVKAWKEKLEPAEYAGLQHKRHVELINSLGIKFSNYSSTATKNHQEVVEHLFLWLEEAGFIDKRTTELFWSEKEHKFLLDRYIEGECPNCGFAKARGDQCDNCGKTHTPDDLINPYSIFGDTELKKKESTNYYLLLDKLQPHLEDYYNELEAAGSLKNWRNHVVGTIKAWFEQGLEPRAITRDMEGYGVKLPVGYEVEGEEGKVVYVWFEAVIGYLSSSVEITRRELPEEDADLFGLDNDDFESVIGEELISDLYSGQSLNWEKYWGSDSTKSLYFMGKDNIPFHGVIWAGMLLGLNKYFAENDIDFKFNLPTNIPANQYLNLKGAKFSKSSGNVISAKNFWEVFGDTTARYFLISRMPENKDYSFTWDEFIEANNNELAANLGNLVNRTLVFWNKAFANNENIDFSGLEIDLEVNTEINSSYEFVGTKLENSEFVSGLKRVMELGSFGNKYFNDSEIWQVIKKDEQKAAEIMFNLLQIIFNLAIIIRPFLPEFSENILEYLGHPAEFKSEVGKNYWQQLQFELNDITEISSLKPLIEKLEIEKITEYEDALS